MSIDGAPIDHDLIGELREWFVGNVRADGPLSTLRVGRQPYGLLPVTASERHDGGGLFETFENFLLDLLAHWVNFDGVPVLDPDSTDVPPDDLVEEQAHRGEIRHTAPLRICASSGCARSTTRSSRTSTTCGWASPSCWD